MNKANEAEILVMISMNGISLTCIRYLSHWFIKKRVLQIEIKTNVAILMHEKDLSTQGIF